MDTALLLPEVNELFTTKLKELAQEFKIDVQAESITATCKLSSILEPHMAYKCSVKKYGTILYRYGGDLLHALNVALGQVRNQSHKSDSDLFAKDKFENQLSETCQVLNAKFHENIKKLIDKDAD